MPAQLAIEGDANGAADGDGWRVRVVAGPLAYLELTPGNVVCEVDSVIAFSVLGALHPQDSAYVIGQIICAALILVTVYGLHRARKKAGPGG